MDDRTYLVASFYKFTELSDYQERQDPLLQSCLVNGVKGTILLALEGINATIAGPDDGVGQLIANLEADPAIRKLTVNYARATALPFHRMKVRLKKEIVRLGLPEINPGEKVGTYVEPEDWNALVANPDLLLIDTRNDYEIEIGTFQGAIDPKTKSFRDFPAFVEKELSGKKERPVAMFCTGGIRCEKATSLLLEKGFREVYHLQGGILNYLEKIDAEESIYEGNCFVFDNRVAVDHQLDPSGYRLCHACRHALDEEDLQAPTYEEGVSCPHCYDTLSESQRERAVQRQQQAEIARAKGRPHVGATPQDQARWRIEKAARRRVQQTSKSGPEGPA